MSTVIVYDIHTDLAAAQTADDAVTLTWSSANAKYPFTNSDAETGSMSGWMTTLGAPDVRSDHRPHTGAYYFHGGSGIPRSLARQRVSPLCLGLTIADVLAGKSIVLDWFGANIDVLSSDKPRISLFFYDASDILLDSYVPSYKAVLLGTAVPGEPAGSPGNNNWLPFQDVDAIPAGTAFIELELDFLRAGGTDNSGTIDDIVVTLEDAQALPYVPGYAVYQDGILVGTAPANATEFVISGLTPGDYEFQLIAYDGTNFLSDPSNTATVHVTLPGEAETHALFWFDDEAMYMGYLGGRLRGTTIACPGENANKVKSCC